MSLQEILAPNLNRYTAQPSGRYLSNRLVTHNGITIAIALGKAEGGSYFFAYSILNAEEESQATKEQATKTGAAVDKLDSQCWFENVKMLQFPSEVRVVGEEAIPVYEIPAVDRSNRKVVRSPDQTERLNTWLSSSLCLMDLDVSDFQVLSDGRYVYLFRQGASAAKPSPNPFMTDKESGTPPVNGTLLCDRFTLVGTTLSQPLEARYQRSRQKQIPLNEQDTLGVKDIDDKNFYEPTHSLRFVQDLAYGRFCVLRAPTVINDVARWLIFAYSRRSGQIECLTTDVASDGLFDLHGRVYYTCDSDKHPKAFANGPGSCTASRSDNGRTCSEARVPILPKTPASKRAMKLSGGEELRLREGINLSGLADGFTLEAWVTPESFWDDTDSPTEGPAEGSFFCLFSQASDGSPGVYLDDKLRVVLRVGPKNESLVASDTSLKVDEWNHVAVTYNPASQTFGLVINGVAAGSVSSEVKPGQLSSLGFQAKEPQSSFRGLLDEVRLWSRPLHPSTLKAHMSGRATGLEPNLEACWHFDEESGTTAFDATLNNRELSVVPIGGGSTPSDVWTRSVAPMVASYGLSRTILRLPSAVEIKGGLGATVYNEQVAVSEQKPQTEEGSKSSINAQANHMKRGARVLLCFVTGTGNSPLRLAVLDFGLLSDGTLPDTPASIPLPALSIAPLASTNTKTGQVGSRVSTALLYVGSQGMEIFGGILAFDAAECGTEAPCPFESAMGTVTIFFRAQGRWNGALSALKYNISRSVVAAAIPASILGGHEGLLATSKLRQAKNLVFQTEPCPWAPAHLAVNLTLTANMADGKKIVETWKGLPPQLDKLYSLLNGTSKGQADTVGELAQLKIIETGEYAKQKTPPTELVLRQALAAPVAAGAYLGVGMRSYMLLVDAKAGDKSLVASLYNDQKPQGKPPGKGSEVIAMSYEHYALITCEGKPAGDFTLGSSLVAMAWSPSSVVTGQAAKAPTSQIQAPGTSFITGSGQSPTFGSPPGSTALRLNGSTVYSMLEDAVATAPCPGICFESWMKVERASDKTIAVAYTSEHSPRADGSPKEEQTFLLGVPQPSSSSIYDLVGNINGLQFFVNQHAALKLGQWAHFACSARNSFALESSYSDYVDLGKAAEWNVSDFSLAFTLQLSESGSGDQTILVKADSASGSTPLHVKVTSKRLLQLSYWAPNEDGADPRERNFYSPDNSPLVAGQAYKVFISRELVFINRPSAAPRSYQRVTMRAWRSDGSLHMQLNPDTSAKLTESEGASPMRLNFNSGAHQTHGAAQGNEAPLSLGGASCIQAGGLRGIIGSIQLYSSAIPTPASALDLYAASGNTKGAIASWSCRDAGGFSLVDDLGRNHGKFKGNLRWLLSPYKPDHQLSVFVNGTRVKHEQPNATHGALLAQAAPAGPHQLTLGNALVVAGADDDNQGRFLGLPVDFCGEFDEMRIWNVPRTRENICDSLHTRLTEVPADMAVYLPFDDANAETSPGSPAQGDDDAILADASVNCFHLTPLFGAATARVASEALVGHDSPCVNHTLGAVAGQSRGVVTYAGPSVAEYGDLQISASGDMEGSFKRAYSYIDDSGKWCLVTGFRIGALKTEWVGQVQTSPTLIGFIEGAPPLPVDTFVDPSSRPATSVHFRHTKRCTYTYSSRFEHISDFDLSVVRGSGAKFQVSAGLGVETETASGQIKGANKTVIDISAGLVNNEVRTSTTNVNMEMGMQLTGVWKEDDKNPAKETYEPSNTGLALVESEVADVFALRLQMRGPIAPLVAYQMRPNPNTPKDRNLVSFEINRRYTKQGCLDGRRGLTNDPDYPPMSSAPKDASYYKPAEAYALRERIRRAEEQRQGEFDRHSLLYSTDLPRRTRRNICNSYVWTADGGTFQETHSTLDMVQSEVGGNLNTKLGVGASFDMELAFGNALATVDVDAMYSAHFNFMMAKEQTSDEGFELDADPPPPVDTRYKDPETGAYVKRPGAVDAYRWMSFWLEPSVEATDTFFEQVLDPAWLEQSSEPNAKLLRSLREALAKETGNARTKAWRVLHRCTYVSRVPEKVEQRPAAPGNVEPEKKSTLLADVACNWLLLQKLEPFARGIESRAMLAAALKPHVSRLFPTLISQTRLYVQVLNLVADYVGLA
ncbi:hypothetical protein BGZ61DRAFT_530066 [Ilyonectria robusta]|uniref:uncharacterized protein n=1 Tax=Ilyonectria robusta TaxID=1079257 RepID=UPI001E8DB95B|nr:uncharacterized protein BGZ61DRAFT_530066 [Ilyonectria robusta]KAH8729939.1 hypothetical protein BGZ61DRAFT_530066 [Ilyonectria robusta]